MCPLVLVIGACVVYCIESHLRPPHSVARPMFRATEDFRALAFASKLTPRRRALPDKLILAHLVKAPDVFNISRSLFRKKNIIMPFSVLVRVFHHGIFRIMCPRSINALRALISLRKIRPCMPNLKEQNRKVQNSAILIKTFRI